MRTHITIDDNLELRVKDYCKINKINFSKGVSELIELGFNNINILESINNIINNLNKLNSKTGYTKDLIEQLYSDLEIETITNPKNKNFLHRDKDDILLEEKIIKLGKLISEKRISQNHKIKYNSIKNKEITNLTKEIKKYVFSKKNADFKNDYDNFKNSLKDINCYFESISKSNNIDVVDNTLIKKKQEYLDNYILNAIVNHAYYRNKNPKISEIELLQAIIYTNYKNNKKQSKFTVLSKSLSSNNRSSKFKNKYLFIKQ